VGNFGADIPCQIPVRQFVTCLQDKAIEDQFSYGSSSFAEIKN
jgi:hypothetical protein